MTTAGVQPAPQPTITTEAGETVIVVPVPQNSGIRQHTFLIDYDFHRALDAETNHDELHWDAVGTDWPVPIEKASVSVRAPVISELRCHAGRQGSTHNCDRAEHDQQTATITHNGLDSSEGITLVVTMPKNQVTVTPPRYDPDKQEVVLWIVAVLVVTLSIPALAVLLLRWDEKRTPSRGYTTSRGSRSSGSGYSFGDGSSSSGGVGGGLGGGGGDSYSPSTSPTQRS